MSQRPEPPRPGNSQDATLSSVALKGVVGVALLAMAVIVYLVIDFIRDRRGSQRFERRRQEAREAWHKETGQ